MTVMDFFKTRDRVSIRYTIRPPRNRPCAGTVILLAGRSEFIEKYEEVITELNGRGFCVYSMDWRGQGLSGRLLSDYDKGYVRSYEDYLLEFSQFMDEFVFPAPIRPLICLAHSMGGHILIRHLMRRPHGMDGAVLTSPMIDICTGPFPNRLARWLCRVAVRSGMAERYASGEGGYRPGGVKRFANNPLTRDFDRYMDMHRAIRAVPGLRLGGVTWGWLHASFESIDILSRGEGLEAIRMPVLIVAAGSDTVVSIDAQKRLAGRLPQGECRVIDDAFHEILKERDAVRGRFWRLFDRFVEENK